MPFIFTGWTDGYSFSWKSKISFLLQIRLLQSELRFFPESHCAQHGGEVIVVSSLHEVSITNSHNNNFHVFGGLSCNFYGSLTKNCQEMFIVALPSSSPYRQWLWPQQWHWPFGCIIMQLQGNWYSMINFAPLTFGLKSLGLWLYCDEQKMANTGLEGAITTKCINAWVFLISDF